MTLKRFLSFCSILFIAFLPLLAFSPFTLAQSGTNVGGLISSDSVWTKAGSPYTFTGSVGISQGITLTIEPGVIINLNSYYLRVNGTLVAKGDSNDKITFNGGQITLLTLTNGWNEQTQTGCIIQNAILSQTTISSVYPIKIDHCTVNGDISVTSSIVTNNLVTGDIQSKSSTVTDNNVKGAIILGSASLGMSGGGIEFSTVSRNIVEGTISSGSTENTPVISENTVTKGGIGCTGYCLIKNNYVYGCEEGISVYALRVFGGWTSCYATVENNLVVGNTKGIVIDLFGSTGGATTIQENTISGNGIGISIERGGSPTIQNNNIQNNTNYSFFLDSPNGVDVSNNWWGTTDESTISQSIYDSKNNIDFGTVTFKPILTSPNPDAPTPTPTAAPTETPQASPTIPEFTTTIALLIILAVTSTAILYKRRN